MTIYFAFPLAAATQQGIDELLANLDSHVTAPQYPLHAKLTVDVTDEILKHCVEGLMAQFQGGDESGGVLHALLGILKGTAHMLIKQLLGKHDNQEVARMAQFLRDRRVVTPSGELRFGFALSPELAARFQSGFAAVAAGKGMEVRDSLHAAMLAFGEEALEHFYDDFVAPMELGFIKRKAADLGRSTLHKGIQVAMNKLFPQLRQPQLAVFATYYGSMIVEA